MKHQGFYHLKTPEDLLNKAKRDLEKHKNDKLNVDLAFNFFVTIEHMTDWLGMNKQERKTIITSSPILKICSHLACGIKHFDPFDTYNSVKSTQETSVYEDGVFEENVYEKWLSVKLDNDEAIEFEAKELGTIFIGENAINYWENYLSENSYP